MIYFTPLIILVLLYLYRVRVLGMHYTNLWYIPWVIGVWLVLGIVSMPIIFITSFINFPILSTIVATLLTALCYILSGGIITQEKPVLKAVLANSINLFQSRWLYILGFVIVFSVIGFFTQELSGTGSELVVLLQELIFLILIFVTVEKREKPC